jgi:hypothetical protein
MMTDWQIVAQNIVLLGGAVGGAAILWRVILRRVFNGIRDGVRSTRAAHQLIQSQLVNNGGSTLLDRMQKTESSTIRTESKVNRIDERVDVLTDSVVVIREFVEELKIDRGQSA